MIVWIVGASSGIGLELTKIWLSWGYKIIASSRTATDSNPLKVLQLLYPDHLVLIDLDVSIDSEEVIKRAWDAFGHIDRWFYNAGAYEIMRLEAWDESHFREINEVNYLGAVRLMVPLSSYFIAQGHGEWIWNISLSSYLGLPYGGAYSAPKAALLNLAESIEPELKSKGIRLRVINHGFVKTRLTQKNDFLMPQLMNPAQAAEKIANALENSHCFEIRFPKLLSLFLGLLRILPYRISLFLTSKALR